MAKLGFTGLFMASDNRLVVIVIPADGPIFRRRPGGGREREATCRRDTCCRDPSIPKTLAWNVCAIVLDSFMTSPS